jgi:hypothetical protein
MRPILSTPRKKEKGQILVSLALLFVSLLIVVGLAVNLGYMYVSYKRQSHIVDAATQSVTALPQKNAPIPDYKQTAREFLALNSVSNETVVNAQIDRASLPDRRDNPELFFDPPREHELGVVTISGNTGVSGAIVTVTYYPGGSTTSDDSGYYSFNVPQHWSGLVTPSKVGYIFTPAIRAYSNVLNNQGEQNYSATARTPDNIAVYRRVTGGAYWLNYNFSTASYTDYLSIGDGGTSDTCHPVSMDFDGDGLDEPTHLCGGGWHFFESNGAFVKSIFAYMQPGDLPVPGDYNGDGTEDMAVYRRTTGGAYWLFYDFATASFTNYLSIGDGDSSDACYPTAMDFDADGISEPTHLCGGGWHFFETNGSFVKSISVYMQVGDQPVPGKYGN